MSDRPGVIPFRYSSMCLAYTVCASLVFLLAPLGTRDSAGTATPERASLLQLNGWRIVLILGLPVIFALVPVLRRGSPHVRTLRAAAAVLLTAFVMLGILSIGIYYLPSAGLMIAAALRERPSVKGPAAGYRPGSAPPSANGQG